MRLIAQGEPAQAVSLISDTPGDAFLIGRLSAKLPTALCVPTEGGQMELQVPVETLLNLIVDAL